MRELIATNIKIKEADKPVSVRVNADFVAETKNTGELLTIELFNEDTLTAFGTTPVYELFEELAPDLNSSKHVFEKQVLE